MPARTLIAAMSGQRRATDPQATSLLRKDADATSVLPPPPTATTPSARRRLSDAFLAHGLGMLLDSPSTSMKRTPTYRHSMGHPGFASTASAPSNCCSASRKQPKSCANQQDHDDDDDDCASDAETTKAERASDPLPSSTSAICTASGRRYGATLLDSREPLPDLALLRDEAEYSDYLQPSVTGALVELDGVTFYELSVQLSQRQWKVFRRFSEFRALRQQLLKHFARRQRGPHKCQVCTNLLQTIQQAPFPSRLQGRWSRHFRSTNDDAQHTYHQGSFSSGGSGNISFNSNNVANSSTNNAHSIVSNNTATSGGGLDLANNGSSAANIAERTLKLQEFVFTCLLTIRGLRQHAKIMYDSATTCEISVALLMIEEFLGLSFTRYLQFLNERGVVSEKAANRRLRP